MQIVIDIPEAEYNYILKSDDSVFADCASKECMMHAIKTGMLLPKGHGRLIDSRLLDKRLNFVLNHTGGYKKTLVGTGIVIAIAENLDAPTVVEAESEGSE